MEFFNQKEEVIEIELTELGRQRLAAGRLKPAFYAFYDDDIIYDGNYGPGNDIQRDIERRILKKTPRVKPNTIFNSVDDSMRKIYAEYEGVKVNRAIDYELNNKQIEDRFPLIPDKKTEYLLPMPLGTSEGGNQSAPSWEINFLKSELSSSQDFLADGNQAKAHFLFDIVPDTAKAAPTLEGQTFTLKDTTGLSIEFTINTTNDPTAGSCTSTDHTTAAGKRICLDVNGDNSASTTAYQVAQQVANKINNSALAITATVPSPNGEVLLVQDFIGDKGNTTISAGNAGLSGVHTLSKGIYFGAGSTQGTGMFHPAFLGGKHDFDKPGAFIQFNVPTNGISAGSAAFTVRIAFDDTTTDGSAAAGANQIGIGTKGLNLGKGAMGMPFDPTAGEVGYAWLPGGYGSLRKAIEDAIEGVSNARVTPSTSGEGTGTNGVRGITLNPFMGFEQFIHLRAETKSVDGLVQENNADESKFSLTSPVSTFFNIQSNGPPPVIVEEESGAFVGQTFLPGDVQEINFDYSPVIKTFGGGLMETQVKESFTGGVDSTFAPLKIPQLNIDIYYDTSIGQITETTVQPTEQMDGSESIIYSFADEIVFNDGSIIKVNPDYILLDIKENNVPNASNNFEVEVYETQKTYGKVVPTYPSLTSQDDLKKLKFASNDKSYIFQDEKLYYPEEKKYLTLDNSYVEYFFDLRVDKEIQEPVDLGTTPALPKNLQEVCED
jgi:hypothetical protein